MKQIPLTNAQMIRLLRLCRILWPEYKKIEFAPLGFVKFIAGDEESITDFLLIHWFELCLYHIPQLLHNSGVIDDDKVIVHRVADEQGHMLSIISGTHPVDYLYEDYFGKENA